MQTVIVFFIAITKCPIILLLIIYTFSHKVKYSYKYIAMIFILFIITIFGISAFLVMQSDITGYYEVLLINFFIIICVIIVSNLLRDPLRELPKVAFTIFLIFSIEDSFILTSEMLQNYFASNGNLQDLFWGSYVRRLGLPGVSFHSILYIIIMPFIFYLIKKYLKPAFKATEDMNFWNYIWLIPVILFTTFRLVIYPSYFNVSPYSYKFVLYLSPLWIICIFIIYLVLLNMLIKTANYLNLKKQLDLSNLHFELQKNHYENSQNRIKDFQMANKNYIAKLEKLLNAVKAKKYDEVDKLLEVNMEIIDNTSYSPYCENSAVDAIIWHFTKLCQDENITIETKINIPKFNFVDSSDLCILIGNLVENAFEACTRQKNDKKFIEINADTPKPSIIAICVKNSYSGEIMKLEKGFLSSKRSEIGIGLKSVEDIAKKYSGQCKFTYTDGTLTSGTFKSNVFLNSSNRI